MYFYSGFFCCFRFGFFYSGCSIRLQAFLQFSDLRIQVTVSIRTASSSFFMRCLQFFLPVLPGCACRCRSSLLLWVPCLLFPVFLTLVLPMDGFASSCLWQHKNSVPLQPLCCTSAAAGCYRWTFTFLTSPLFQGKEALHLLQLIYWLLCDKSQFLEKSVPHASPLWISH